MCLENIKFLKKKQAKPVKNNIYSRNTEEAMGYWFTTQNCRTAIAAAVTAATAFLDVIVVCVL